MEFLRSFLRRCGEIPVTSRNVGKTQEDDQHSFSHLFVLFFSFFFSLPITVTSADCPPQYCLTQLTLVSSNTKNDHFCLYAIYVKRLP